MSWMKVLPVDSLSEDERQVVKVGEHNILLLYHENQLIAIDNKCPHLKLPLKKGQITSDGALVCPWHKSAFDLCTGEVKQWTPWPPIVGKALGMINNEKALSVFPVKVEEGDIYVEIEKS